jgi:hypothetical protein
MSRHCTAIARERFRWENVIELITSRCESRADGDSARFEAAMRALVAAGRVEEANLRIVERARERLAGGVRDGEFSHGSRR